MDNLTLQAFLNEKWTDIAHISFPKSGEGNYRITELEYISDYALEQYGKDDYHAVSLNHPVALFFDDVGQPGWLRFLDDIMPSGASRRYWVKFLDIDELHPDEQDYVLLRYGTMSPVGNLRIKESLPEYSAVAESLYFTLDDVKNRAGDFLDYAQQKGAAAGGATGAGGEAPKLLLRCSEEEKIWIDTHQKDNTNQDIHYLVKYPRGTRSEIDCNILRAEYHYYHELADMGFDAISTKGMRLEEGISYPSLWLPRFDIAFDAAGSIERFGMESVYSLLRKGPGVTLNHEDTIREILDKITKSHMVIGQGFQFDVEGFVVEWVKRDLLNIIFGNSDNHGRNTSFLKGNGMITLAPIYDFAPMKADPEGIPRTTKWISPLEVGGTYDFLRIADSVSDLVSGEVLISELKDTADKLIGLKERLAERGVPEQILNMPAIGMDFIPEKLTRWGLL